MLSFKHLAVFHLSVRMNCTDINYDKIKTFFLTLTIGLFVTQSVSYNYNVRQFSCCQSVNFWLYFVVNKNVDCRPFRISSHLSVTADLI